MTDTEPEQLGEIDQAASAANTEAVDEVDKVEGQIRAFVRRDFRRRRSETRDLAVDDNSGIYRVAGASISEIERVINELSSIRDMLRSEGNRVQREIAGFASLSQVVMASTKVIADSLAQWKSQTPMVGQREG